MKTSFPNDSFLDAVPLHLSANGALDDFDFILEEGEDGERLFADSKNSTDLEVLLSNSRGSAAMDFETLESSLNNMRFDSIQENEQMRTSCGSHRPSRRSRQRDSSPSPQAGTRNPRFQMNTVNFDPPSQLLHQTSHSDLSMCSHATAQSSSGVPPSDAQYTEALQNLAESMKRTEESRRHVMMQRNMLTLAQQQALSSAKEELNQRQQQVQQQQQHQVAPPQAVNSQRDLDGRSSIMAAFFSGSRGTLTNGLEQSRKQLGMYMGSVNRVG
eukprot:CAMPEP_0201872564 /NCGR_PEP_ID=MMETSP0902-20130614/5247_1 /ASSEMBLY_ACC=CAM_ASM_000551 /TAXON_ID=420261 /ORGANISM="Thalassiosira antarctica, Strain CCMP982" /LENGTH=270 /DNA_ID=CAMNT_0048398877 /DNA_START=76 /DNA_END=888 /DNA_ORIENTATION=+